MVRASDPRWANCKLRSYWKIGVSFFFPYFFSFFFQAFKAAAFLAFALFFLLSFGGSPASCAVTIDVSAAFRTDYADAGGREALWLPPRSQNPHRCHVHTAHQLLQRMWKLGMFMR